MINPTLTLKDKALAGVMMLRNYAAMMTNCDDPMMRLSAEPHLIAANAIEQIIKENTCLRNQLVAFQAATDTTVAFDPAKENAEHTCQIVFTKGTRVCLKTTPLQRGTVKSASRDGDTRRVFVSFDSPFEEDRWVKVSNLELVPGQ